MLVVDSQVHLWGAETPDRPWPSRGGNLRHRFYTAESLLREMDDAGVDRAILVPPVFEGDRNDVVLAAATKYPTRFAVMGRLALDRPESRDAIERWRETPGMLGVRQSFHTAHHRQLLMDGSVDWFWRAAERQRLPVFVFAPGGLDKLGLVARTHPGLSLIICHMGLAPDATLYDLQRVPDQLLKLATIPNVAVKASALPCHAQERFPFPSVREPLERVIQAFGSDRVFWGSDLTRLPCTYREVVDFAKHLPFLTTVGVEKLMGAALLNWLRWPTDVVQPSFPGTQGLIN